MTFHLWNLAQRAKKLGTDLHVDTNSQTMGFLPHAETHPDALLSDHAMSESEESS